MRHTRLRTSSEIGGILTNLRGDRTQAAVAEAIGVDRTTYIGYEAGRRVPRDEVKCQIATFYDVSVEDIFYAADDTNCDQN